jgi:hypothetical protein
VRQCRHHVTKVGRSSAGRKERTISQREPIAGPGGRRRPRVQAGALWAGGVATALVAALVATVGELIFEKLFDMPLLSVTDGATTTWADRGSYAVGAALLALLATALLHLLTVAVPQPARFFTWVLVLVAVILVAAPFAYVAPRSTQVATAVTGLCVVVAIGALLPGVARRAVVVVPDGRHR